jgi:hypothetical protein
VSGDRIIELEPEEVEDECLTNSEDDDGLTKGMNMAQDCLCCKMKKNEGAKKVCPVSGCGHVFQGKGWDGIDAHWRAKHEKDLDISYEEFWSNLCDKHR